jgi:hypothetical protein
MHAKPFREILAEDPRHIYGTPEWIHLEPRLNTPDPAFDNARAVVDTLIDKGVKDAVDVWNTHFGRLDLQSRLIVQEFKGEVEVQNTPPPTRIDQDLKRLLLSKSSRHRMRRCPEDQVYFYDTTKRAVKRYCSNRCASRVRMRAHRHKRVTR